MGRLPVPEGCPLKKEQARGIGIQTGNFLFNPVNIIPSFLKTESSQEIQVKSVSNFRPSEMPFVSELSICQKESRNCPASALNRNNTREPPQQQWWWWGSALSTVGRTCALNQRRSKGKQIFLFQELRVFGQECFQHLLPFLLTDASQNTIRKYSLAKGAGKSPGQVTGVGLFSCPTILFTHLAQIEEESGSILVRSHPESPVI